MGQLETLCEYIKGRWEDQHTSVKDLPHVKDITQIVGTAALIFTAGEEGGRANMLKRVGELVAHKVEQCSNLKRLSAAGRLLIIVLDKSQAPSTYFQRTIAAHYERLNVQNERLQDAIDDAHWQLRGCIASQSR